MGEDIGFWAVAGLLAAVGGLAVAAAMLDSVMGAAAMGHARPVAAMLDPVRETARLLVQQRSVVPASDSVLRLIGTGGIVLAAALAALVVPVGMRPVADLDIGVVWFNAMEVLVWAALWLIGWGSNAAFGLVGGYRIIAQGLAYELPHMFALITAALGAGSLRVGDVVAAQSGLWFVVWMPVAFAVYLLSALAMAFWGPLGQPVDEDLAGGAVSELAAVDRLVFLAGRYALLAVTAAFAVPLFLGGGAGPWLPGWLWMLLKTLAVLGVLVWARWRLPTMRMDRFMEAAWVVLIPAILLQALVVGIVVVARG
ncbi:complex I subunit 1 family protein [Actinomadura rudentiformis]|uniref:NADH-quinone oxidoreductase subunit H n=1 Tax=Actinomadura rudentiformis TaxID=359158 RepID=A0A6H9YWX1_9ACTN|nr:complex I subunit 1 family protein [Actinomadura rudentiformis]KAB2346942.1 NADH-quinone oxidoreductase subunit H [Actinomadura rudentiformis]